LVGTHDCAAWANSLAEARTTVRTVMRCEAVRRGPLVLLFVEANAFLRSMVRNIAGTLVEVGLGRRAPEDVARITESRNRAEAGHTAPACGLCLLRVRY
jgi:tRNA pseudouridine38-40 synthase